MKRIYPIRIVLICVLCFSNIAFADLNKPYESCLRLPLIFNSKVKGQIDTKTRQGIFDLSAQRIRDIVTQADSLPPSSNLRSLLIQYALHYLRSGAPWSPMLLDGPHKVSIFDWLKKDNTRSEYYFRNHGGTTENIYKDLLALQTSNIELNNLFLLEHLNFKCVINRRFKVIDMDGRLLTDEKDIPEIISRITVELERQENYSRGIFIDVTKLIAGDNLTFSKKVSLLNSISSYVQRGALQCPTIIIVGAFMSAEDGQPILYAPGITDEVRAEIRTIQARTGYFPDIMKLNISIGRLTQSNLEPVIDLTRFGMGHFLQLHSESEKPSGMEGTEKDLFSDLSNSYLTVLRAINTDSRANELHRKILITILSELWKEVETFLGRNDNEQVQKATIVKDSMQRINNIIGQLQDTKNITIFRDHFELIMEEVILILSIIEPPNMSLKQSVNDITLLMNDMDPDVYIFNSGMKAYYHIIEGLYNICAGRTLTVAYSSDIYFEGREIFEILQKRGLVNAISIDHALIDKLGNPSECPLDKTVLSELDCIFVDMHPNEASANQIFSHNVTSILDFLMNIRKANAPLTVVIDTTMHQFNDDDIKTIIKDTAQIQKYVNEGKLNLVLCHSLSKYTTFGLYKFSSGAVIAYNKGPQFSNFDSYLNRVQNGELLSPQADIFLAFLLKHSHKLSLDYLGQVRENAVYMNHQLSKQLSDSEAVIKLADRKDGEATYLGLYYNTSNPLISRLLNDSGIVDESKLMRFNEFVLNYIYVLARLQGLPITQRMGYGHFHTNLCNLQTAIRIALGVEDKETLDKYAQIISTVNRQIIHGIKEEKVFDQLLTILGSEKIEPPGSIREIEGINEILQYIRYLQKCHESAHSIIPVIDDRPFSQCL